MDFLGVNYYHPSRVQEPEFSSDSLAQDWLPEKYYASFNKRGVRMNADRGWEIHLQTIYKIAKTIQKDYNNIPWFISENGMGVENEARFEDTSGVIQDDYRIQFMTEHLYYLHQFPYYCAIKVSKTKESMWPKINLLSSSSLENCSPSLR